MPLDSTLVTRPPDCRRHREERQDTGEGLSGSKGGHHDPPVLHNEAASRQLTRPLFVRFV